MMMKRKAAYLFLGVYDCVALLLVCGLLCCAFPRQAFAYVDPSVMTYTIQAVAGVAVALSAVAGVAFRRTRKSIMRALNIDENANKEVDSDWYRIEAKPENLTLGAGFSSDVDASQTAAESSYSKNKRNGSSVSRIDKAMTAICVSLFCCFTLLVIAPFEIVAGSTGDLLFGLGDVVGPVLLFALIAMVVLSLLLFVMPQKAFIPVACFVFAIGLCCYIQAMFLNAGIPQADGRPVDWWGGHGQAMVISSLVWLAVIALVLAMSFFKQNATRLAVCAVSLALVVVQGVGVVSLFAGSDPNDSGDVLPAITEAGLFEVSAENNVIVFILDYYDTATLKTVVEEHPDVLAEKEGFTWYQNSTGVMIPTGFALPYLMTAEVPAKGQSIDEYMTSRYTSSSFIEDLHDSEYSVGLYTTTFGFNYLTAEQRKSEVYDNVSNAHVLDEPQIDSFGAVWTLTKAALYRDAPWAAKPRFRFYTDDINKRAIYTDVTQPADDAMYVMDDAKFFDRLRYFGLALDDSDASGAFRMIHLNGGHSPYTIDENGKEVGEGNTDKIRQSIGAMRMVDEYLSQMKELGVYDDATIIITSDHGDWQASMELPEMATSPIMLVKRPHAGNDSVKISQAPVSHEDYFATVLNAMGQDYDNYGHTFDYWQEDDNRERFFYYVTSDYAPHIHSLRGYWINGDANDFGNWTYTGDVWDCNILNN